MSLTDYMQILSYLKQCGIKSISLTGGDVFLHPCFNGIVTAAESEQFEITLLVNSKSNHRKIIEWVRTGRKMNLTFSDLSHMSKEFVQTLFTSCDDLKNVHFIITVMDQINSDIISFIHLLNDYKIVPEVNLAFLDYQTASYIDHLESCVQELVFLTLQGEIKVTSEYVTALIADYVRGHATVRCSIHERFKVDLNGNVYLCPFLYKEEHSVYNVFSHQRKNQRVNIEKVFLDRKGSSPCDCCELFDLCLGGCPLCSFYGEKYSKQHCRIIKKALCAIKQILG